MAEESMLQGGDPVPGTIKRLREALALDQKREELRTGTETMKLNPCIRS
jgi:hypothetical protein